MALSAAAHRVWAAELDRIERQDSRPLVCQSMQAVVHLIVACITVIARLCQPVSAVAARPQDLQRRNLLHFVEEREAEQVIDEATEA